MATKCTIAGSGINKIHLYMCSWSCIEVTFLKLIAFFRLLKLIEPDIVDNLNRIMLTRCIVRLDSLALQIFERIECIVRVRVCVCLL